MERHVYRVSELLEVVNRQLAGYRDIFVEGEVTNFVRSPPGHLYFSIKDAKAQVSVVMFGMYARELKFRIENGLKVILRGRLKVYEQRGTFQIMADSVEPAGLGALQLAFEQLKARLTEEGLFAAERKKPIPMLPQRIAIVTSPTGAAIRDIIHVLGRRFSGLSVQIYPVRVQGPTAAREIASAIRNLSKWNLHDVILICRGGGSLEDLWSFNEEVVARAVAECSIPTISGVGHETDFTICDFVADLRAPTPSAAAEIVIRAKSEICLQIDHAVHRIRKVIDAQMKEFRGELRHFASSDGLGIVTRRVRAMREKLQRNRVTLYQLTERQARAMRRRLAEAQEPLSRFPMRLALKDRMRYLVLVEERIGGAIVTRLGQHRRQLQSLVGTLEAVSPLSVLSRGYAIAFTRRGGQKRRPILSSMSVAIGDPIEVQLKKGQLNCTVDGQTTGLESVWPPLKSRKQ